MIGGNFPVVFVAPKFTTKVANDIRVGGGANLLLVPDNGFDSDRNVAGAVYGVTSFGNINTNLTLGIGYGIISDEFIDTPAFQIGGMIRASKSIVVVTDHILVDTGDDLDFFGTFSVRYITKNIGIDIGIVTAYSNGAIPIVGVVIK